jgi:glycosyltransferase involved in cell wall biosynthesis
MLISVIIPTFNEEKFLPELIINLQEFKQKAEQIIGIR